MSFRRHPTKNKKRKPGEPIAYQFECGYGENRVTIVKEFPSDLEAELYDNELKRSHRPKVSTLVAPSFEKIVPDFLTWYALHRRPRSLEAWLQGWKNLEPHFAKLKPGHLTPGMIDQYKAHRLSQKAGKKNTLITKRTVAKELANLSALITYAVDRGLCDPLPFKLKAFPKKQVRPPRKIIPAPEQIVKMLALVRSDVRPLYQLIYYAGLRSEEARTLQAKHVDLARGLLSIVGKGDKARVVPIAEPLRPILEKALEGKSPDDVVMISHRTGKPYARNIGKINTAAQRAGITSHISAHTLRHCFGTHAIYWGMDLRTVQLILGHSDSSTTEIYTSLAATFLSEQMKRFGVFPTETAQKEATEQPPAE